jgi:hypothetical protein
MSQKSHLHHPATCKIVDVVLRELFTPDIEGVKSIRSVGGIFMANPRKRITKTIKVAENSATLII